MAIKTKKERFPIWIFAVYLFYFAGQAIYNTYLNLYLSEIGLGTSQIGFMISVSTAVVLVAQTLWGSISDRAGKKNRVIRFLYLMSAITALSFYATRQYLFVLILVSLFSAFFMPIVPLNDNITLEALRTSKWDYGWLRMGGTIGYAITVLWIGSLVKNSYASIFMLVATAMGICLLASFFIPAVQGYQAKGKRPSMRLVLADKTLTGLIFFHLMYALGNSFFYSFYPIRFLEIGGDSKMIGWMMFICAVVEIPCLMIIHKVVQRIGIRGVLLLAGVLTCIRWFLLAILKVPMAIIAVNLLHGFSYTGITYCVLNYINNKVPKELRASSQVWNATMSTVCSRLLFGYIGGVAYEMLGADYMMMVSGILIGATTIWFLFWSKSRAEALEIFD